MLAGRKLLLADDSITIQKVVELTFADEGVTVVSVGNGNDAVGKLAEFMPDIVLADACMPSLNGYEVCEYIKQNASLKHIPVMLLVGSFEPFDEAEARKVGADDILTKPFQSIRRLIDKVGGLVSSKPEPDQSELIPTAELPHTKEVEEPATLSPRELEVTTANTQPLPLSSAMETKEAQSVGKESDSSTQRKEVVVESSGKEQKMESAHSETSGNAVAEQDQIMSGDELLDLGDLEPASDGDADAFVLDINLDEQMDESEYVQTPTPAWSSSRVPAFVEPEVSAPNAVDWLESKQHNGGSPRSTTELVGNADQFHQEQLSTTSSQFDDTQEWNRGPAASSEPQPSFQEADATGSQTRWERVTDEPADSAPAAAAASNINVNRLSPEMIDAIARRAVEHLSEKVIREIAWEVVPQLSELLIKRRLEEKESQAK